MPRFRRSINAYRLRYRYRVKLSAWRAFMTDSHILIGNVSGRFGRAIDRLFSGV